MRAATAYAPASIGNIGPGFDVLGVAVSNLGDWVTASRKRCPGVEIISIEGDGGKLSAAPKKNTAAIAAAKVIEAAGSKEGLNLRIKKGVPFPSGLGSSAASAVAGGFAANLALGEPLNQSALLTACTAAEAAVSGGFFCDNTAAALYGGGVVTKSENGCAEAIPLGTIPKAVFIIAQPDFPMPTKKSRSVLPGKIPLHNFVMNMAAAAAITAAFLKKDAALLGGSIDDRIIEPARAGLIPGFFDVKKAALEAGAFGCSISGGGPSVFAVADVKSPADRIGEAMKKAFSANGARARIHICNIDPRGARLVVD